MDDSDNFKICSHGKLFLKKCPLQNSSNVNVPYRMFRFGSFK